MKITKILSALALTTAVCATNVSAYDAYLYGEYVNITTVEFSDANGAIEALPGSGDVTVSLSAKKGKNAELYQPVTVVAALYNGENLQSVVTQNVDLQDSYTKKVSFNVDVTGATGLRVYVCDSLDNGRPFASKAIFAESSKGIKAITVGGEAIEGFSPEVKSYAVTVPANFTTYPEITPQLIDSSAWCELEFTGSFPLSEGETAKATIKVGKENPDVYTVVITQEQPAVTNLKIVDEIKAGEEIIDTAPSIVLGVEPEKYGEMPTVPIKFSTNSSSGDDMTEGYGYGNVTGTAFFSDRSAYATMFVPTELQSAYMIRPKMYFENKSGSYISFDINSPATVYAAVKAPAEFTAAGYTLDPTMKISYNNCNAEAGRLYSYDAYKKHFDVPAGETLTVVVPHGCINAYVVFDKSNPVSNPILTHKNGTVYNLPTVDVRNAEYLAWNHPNYSDGIGSYSYACKFISDKQTDDYKFATDFPAELLGSTGIAIPNNPRNYNSSTQNTDFINFELNQSADVYVAYESDYDKMPWMEELGYEDVSDQIGAIKYVDSEDTIEYTTRIYKKSYTVVPGETVKASVGGFPKVDDNPETDDKYTIPPMIFVKAK